MHSRHACFPAVLLEDDDVDEVVVQRCWAAVCHRHGVAAALAALPLVGLLHTPGHINFT